MTKPDYKPSKQDVAQGVGKALEAFKRKYEQAGHGDLPVSFLAAHEPMEEALHAYIMHWNQPA